MATSPSTGALVDALTDILSWLLLALSPRSPASLGPSSVPMRQDASESGAHSQQFVDYGILELMHEVKQVLMQLPNGALFLLHPPSRPGWGDLAAFNPGVRLAFFAVHACGS